VLGLLAAGLVAAYPAVLRPWHLRWGTTDAEARAPLPGDALIPRPASVSTRAVTVGAPPAAVWPWLTQLGQERAGLYSYAWLENLAGSGIRNADRLVPAWQAVAVGDPVRLASAARYPGAYLLVAAVEPGRALVLRSPNVPGGPGAGAGDFGYSWAFVLAPAAREATRLVVRARYRGPRAAVAVSEALQFVMERRMLLGIRARAERAAYHGPGAAPRPAPGGPR
jgi:hypothetical protein